MLTEDVYLRFTKYSCWATWFVVRKKTSNYSRTEDSEWTVFSDVAREQRLLIDTTWHTCTVVHVEIFIVTFSSLCHFFLRFLQVCSMFAHFLFRTHRLYFNFTHLCFQERLQIYMAYFQKVEVYQKRKQRTILSQVIIKLQAFRCYSPHLSTVLFPLLNFKLQLHMYCWVSQSVCYACIARCSFTRGRRHDRKPWTWANRG